MTKKYLFYKRKTAIIFTDTILFAAGLSIWSLLYFKYNWSFSIVSFLVLFFGFYYAFFLNRIIRYIFSIFFSILYGLVAAAIGAAIGKEDPIIPSIIFGVLAFLISLYLHKDHFDFLKNSKHYEYDRY